MRPGPDAARRGEERRGKGVFLFFFLFCFLGGGGFAALRLIENIILNVFPGDEGLQEVPPMCRGPQVPPHK